MDVALTQQVRIWSLANSEKNPINDTSAKTMLGTSSSVKSEALTPGVLHLVPGTIFEKNTVISWKESGQLRVMKGSAQAFSVPCTLPYLSQSTPAAKKANNFFSNLLHCWLRTCLTALFASEEQPDA